MPGSGRTEQHAAQGMRVAPSESVGRGRPQTTSQRITLNGVYGKSAKTMYEPPLFKLCYRESINHKLIPPGEKELQGLVERSHRQDDQELFSRIAPKDIHEFNRLLEQHYLWRNQSRRFKKLSWLTPDGWLQCYLNNVVTLPPLLEWGPPWTASKKRPDLAVRRPVL